MSADRILQANIHEALRGYHSRGQREVVTVDMPFDSILSAESDGEEGEAGEYEMKQRRAAVRAMFRYITAEGPNPLKLMKRLYALGRGMMVDPFCNLTMEEAGMMFGETKAAVSYRLGLLSGTVKACGLKGSRLSGQKNKSATPNYSKAQKGNTNRKKKACGRQVRNPQPNKIL